MKSSVAEAVPALAVEQECANTPWSIGWLVAGLIAAALIFSGCVRQEAYDLVPAYDPAYTITEREAQIARDLGCTDEQVDRMLSGEIEYDEYSNILYAEAMLDHLEQAYGLEFRAIGTHAPEMLNSKWSLSASVVGGEHDGAVVHCSWVWKDEEEPFFTDDAISTLRGDELEAWLCSAADDELGRFGAVCYSHADRQGEITSSCGMDDPIGDVSACVWSQVYIFFPPWCGLDRQEYDEALASLARRYVDVGGEGSLIYLSACRVDVLPDGTVPSEETFEAQTLHDVYGTRRMDGEDGLEWVVDGMAASWDGNPNPPIGN